MGDRIYAVEEKEAVEQVSIYLKMLTSEQQREFSTLIKGAIITMQVVGCGEKEAQDETA
ncbi:hypothetical protein [Metasolibacillus meyeri]|uniref:hypothetical protein n=1 Tax=Metasolibacillus meyeri TaxID=1071052 RepID=UPI00187D5542|nr:hypothetical protein [Metasolibacillus meyeri]